MLYTSLVALKSMNLWLFPADRDLAQRKYNSAYHSTSSSTVKDSANGTSKTGKSFCMFALKVPFMSAGKKKKK